MVVWIRVLRLVVGVVRPGGDSVVELLRLRLVQVSVNALGRTVQCRRKLES